MTTKRKLYNAYTKEFKLEALRMMDESNRPASAIGITRTPIIRNQ